MAVLNDTDRFKVLGQIVRDYPWPGLNKPDVQAAINAIDDWIETNQSAINNAFPQPFKGTATLQQKALVLAYVTMRRGNLLKVQGE